MTLVACWLLLPVALGLVSLGCGALLERAAGGQVPGPLLVPLGLAAVIALSGFTTALDATAELTVPLACVLGAAGLLLLARGRARAVDGWALGVCAGTYLAFALPVVASGEATFAGYVKLDDTASWLAISDHVLEHGRDVDGLAPSSYEATVSSYIGNGYPIGSFVPLGLAERLLGQDAAWLFQPLLAFYAAMLALCLYWITAGLVRSPRARALVVFVAAQPALLFAYSLWGGLKEVALAFLLALFAALLARAAVAPGPARALLPAAVTVAAVLTAASAAGALWLFAPALVALALAARGAGMRSALARAGALLALTVVLAVPAVLLAASFLSEGGVHTLTADVELGNLAEPLDPLQALGIWPAGDFRFDPESRLATYVLVGLLALAAVGGLVAAWRRREWSLMLLVAAAGAGCAAIAAFGSPWVDAKAFAIASCAPVLAGMVGAAVAWEGGRRFVGALLAVGIGAGVVWSNALAYGEVNLAPRERLAELERVGERIAGEGPTLMTEYEPYGVRHFLRDADAEGASEFRRRKIPLRGGRSLGKLGFADIDEFQLEAILTYRTLVLRRSPIGSRPPSPYRLVERGRYYDVWQRGARASRTSILAHLPLGDRNRPSEVPSCAAVLRLARLASPKGSLVAVPKRPPVVHDLASGRHPRNWAKYPLDDRILLPLRAGNLNAALTIAPSGEYGAWIGGAFRRRLELQADGRTLASERHRLSHSNQFEPIGTATFGAGRHVLTLRYGERDLRPGTRGSPFPIGPLVLSPVVEPRPVRVRPGAARKLCGKHLDWIEATAEAR